MSTDFHVPEHANFCEPCGALLCAGVGVGDSVPCRICGHNSTFPRAPPSTPLCSPLTAGERANVRLTDALRRNLSTPRPLPASAVHLADAAALSSLTPAIGEVAATLDIKPSDLLRRLSGRVSKDARPADEAVVDEECPACKKNGLSYHTAQLRGLDEGQTVFYTCLNTDCKHKFNVNA
jgi:DNA-directed RNA polymerase I subunit RPA12